MDHRMAPGKVRGPRASGSSRSLSVLEAGSVLSRFNRILPNPLGLFGVFRHSQTDSNNRSPGGAIHTQAYVLGNSTRNPQGVIICDILGLNRSRQTVDGDRGSARKEHSMTRTQSGLVLVLTLVLGASFISAAIAQEESRRRSGRGFSRSSLIGLLGLEQVQKEMKLNEEQVATVKTIVESASAEMREQYGALREMEDWQKRMEKMAEIRDEFDGKVREQLRDVVPREQMMRLYQIRMQVRAVVDSLANTWVARRLELTDGQKEKVAQIDKEMQSARSELFASMRDASAEQRGEIFQKFRQIVSNADEKALTVLTAAQRDAFEEMKGEKIELQFPQRR